MELDDDAKRVSDSRGFQDRHGELVSLCSLAIHRCLNPHAGPTKYRELLAEAETVYNPQGEWIGRT